ncbi:MAG: DUF4305 domain-containing protein [Carnobacterium sp.]|uniref:DUF4305 domain-containing protein n=1 Tax=Carnobacterium sp. TaxID=48221 RepID=UPI003314C761
MQIVFTYLMSGVFIWFAIDSVGASGWSFFSVLYVVFSTSYFVRASKILEVYFKIKKGPKP